jgi:hypothetical protein
MDQSALNVFFRIAKEWGLNSAQEQIVLGTNQAKLFDWKAGHVDAPLEPVVLERLSYLFRIYGALEMLLPIPERANQWIWEVNTAPLFGGTRALDRMLVGQADDHKVVADYLDAQLGVA